jgi:hypothetical protein
MWESSVKIPKILDPAKLKIILNVPLLPSENTLQRSTQRGGPICRPGRCVRPSAHSMSACWASLVFFCFFAFSFLLLILYFICFFLIWTFSEKKRFMNLEILFKKSKIWTFFEIWTFTKNEHFSKFDCFNRLNIFEDWTIFHNEQFSKSDF